MKVIEYIAKSLVETFSFSNFFGVSGANIEDMFASLERLRITNNPKINIILAKHEFSAVAMADGHYRVSQKIAVVMSTSGGAALNILAGLGEAYNSHIPMLVFVGAPSLSIEGKGAFQDSSGKGDSFSIMEMYKAVTCYAKKITEPQNIHEVIEDAIKSVKEHRRPALIVLPKNIQMSELLENKLGQIFAETTTPPISNSLIQKLEEYKGKLIFLIGAEGSMAHIHTQIYALVKHLDAKVLLAPEGKGAFPEMDQRFLGISGVMGVPVTDIQNELEKAEAFCLVGTSANCMERFGLEPIFAKKGLFAISSNRPYVDSTWLTFYQTTNLTKTLDQILSLINVDTEKDEILEQTFTSGYSNMQERISINHLGKLFSEIAMNKTANWFIDAGNVVCNVVKNLKIKMGSTFNIALGMGGMGYSFGASIGGYLANRLPTYVLSGDGSFFMHGMDIHTALEHNLPICFFIGNNNGHAMCRSREILYSNIETTINKFQASDLAQGLSNMFPSLSVLEIKTIGEFYAHLPALKGIKKTTAVVFSFEIDELTDFGPFVDQAKKIKERT